MIVTGICVTYGRVDFLNNALACFLAQDYPEGRLIILNTLQAQELHFGSHYNVEVINVPRREFLGQSRDEAIARAKDGIIVTWDDDDLYRPRHLSTIAAAFRPEDQWIWLDKMFFTERGRIKRHVTASPNTFAFRKSAWSKVGGYGALNTGEDRELMRKISSLPGQRVSVPVPNITFLYGWDTGSYHLSGYGFDQAGKPTGYARVEETVTSQVATGKIPSGKIVLQPNMDLNPEVMAKQWLGENHYGAAENFDVCIIELGRYGDIINALPLALHIHNTYRKPFFMVSRKFANVLSGVSYVEPVITDLPHDQPLLAVKEARERFGIVLLTQVWGQGHNADHLTEAYNLESWRLAGMAEHFFNSTLLPLFDQRNFGREKELVEKTGDPVILLGLESISSPYRLAADLTKRIAVEFPGMPVLNLSEVRLDHFSDLLGIFDHCAKRGGILVAVDTAYLHLLPATTFTLPCVALTNPKPWYGSLVRTKPVWTHNYDANLDAVIHSMRLALDESRMNPYERTRIWPAAAPKRRLIHVVEQHEDNRVYSQRRAEAQRTWASLDVVPVRYSQYARSARDIGDPRTLPYLRDVLDHGLKQTDEDDILMITNDDVYLHPKLQEVLQFYAGVYGATSAQRLDFKADVGMVTPEEGARIGRRHVGRDLFAFTRQWLARHMGEIPDFILGASEWDLCLACLIRLHCGIHSTKANLSEIIFPCEIPRGYVTHRMHRARWLQSDNVDSAPSQIHNRKLFREWASKHLPKIQFSANNTI